MVGAGWWAFAVLWVVVGAVGWCFLDCDKDHLRYELERQSHSDATATPQRRHNEPQRRHNDATAKPQHRHSDATAKPQRRHSVATATLP